MGDENQRLWDHFMSVIWLFLLSACPPHLSMLRACQPQSHGCHRDLSMADQGHIPLEEEGVSHVQAIFTEALDIDSLAPYHFML